VKKFIATAVAGALAGQAAGHAWQAHHGQPRPAPCRAHEAYRRYRPGQHPPAAPRTWAEARNIMLAQAAGAARREVLRNPDSGRLRRPDGTAEDGDHA
jgi:hypothetical protein